MRISNSEHIAIRQVVEFGHKFGFGNLIAHLQTAWARSLMDGGASEESARRGSGGPGYPFPIFDDLHQNGEWDETGKKYRTNKKAKRL